MHEGKKIHQESTLVVFLPKTKNKDELLKELSIRLRFPGYFGHNWDALLDMLCDFHWVEPRSIVLVHEELPVLASSDMRTYLEILFDSIFFWKMNNKHDFEVKFPLSNKKIIIEFLNSYASKPSESPIQPSECEVIIGGNTLKFLKLSLCN